MSIVDWRKAQGIRPSDFEIVIFDTRIKARTREELKYYASFFQSMRPETENLLQAGGVVIVLACASVPVRVYQGQVEETNYDFLPEDFLSETLLSQSSSQMGTHYEISKDDWNSYFYSKPKYFKAVNVRSGADEPPYILRGSGLTEKVRPLALTTVTSEIVAALVSWSTGVVGILPPPNDMFQALLFLKDKGPELYRENTESVGGPIQAPAWLKNYRSSEHEKLDQKVNSLSTELQSLEEKRRPFLVASSCLYSTSKRLERAVTRIFSDFDWDTNDLTKTGQPIDYVIRTKRDASVSLTVTLTGTSGYIDSKSGKLAQLLGAFPEVGEKGRLVFLVNGSTDVDPASRSVANYITDEALKRLTKNDVRVLLMYDLYRLWMDYLDRGRTSEQIFKSLYDTIGLFKYPPP